MRVNIVPVIELTDQHLRAEYLEIQLLCDSLRRTLASRYGFVASKVPSRFTLNTGHVYFFFNKGKYLNKRYNQLVREATRRRYTLVIPFPRGLWPPELFNNWEPEDGDFNIIRQRIADRVMRKPHWYRYYKQPLTDQRIASYAHQAQSN